MVSLLDQLDTLAQALDTASGEADYADDIALKTQPEMRDDIQAVDREIRRLYRRVEKLQLRAARIPARAEKEEPLGPLGKCRMCGWMGHVYLDDEHDPVSDCPDCGCTSVTSATHEDIEWSRAEWAGLLIGV